jgi:hypothetical protein
LAAVLGFFNGLVDPFGLLGVFFGRERFAVACGHAVDADAFDGDALGVFDGGLFYMAFAVPVFVFEVDAVGVFGDPGFGDVLVAFDVKEEFADGRKGFFVRCWGGRLGAGQQGGGPECGEEEGTAHAIDCTCGAFFCLVCVHGASFLRSGFVVDCFGCIPPLPPLYSKY